MLFHLQWNRGFLQWSVFRAPALTYRQAAWNDVRCPTKMRKFTLRHNVQPHLGQSEDCIFWRNEISRHFVGHRTSIQVVCQYVNWKHSKPVAIFNLGLTNSICVSGKHLKIRQYIFLIVLLTRQLTLFGCNGVLFKLHLRLVIWCFHFFFISNFISLKLSMFMTCTCLM